MIELIQTDGIYYAGFPQDHLFKLIKAGNGFVDDFLKDVIDRYVKPDSVCIDVGANLGYVSIYLSKRCKKVIALEPQPTVFMQLCANLFLNECLNVQPLQFGAHSKTCILGFADYQSGWVGTKDLNDYSKIGSIGSVSLHEDPDGAMAAFRLDSVIFEKVSFIKVDAQGADVDTVLGCELLMGSRPVIAFEYEDDLSRANYNRTLADLNPFLEKHRYGMRTLHGGNYLLLPE